VKAPVTELAAAAASATDGAVPSKVRDSCVAAVLEFPAASVAPFAATSTDTEPSATGVTVKE